MNPVISIFVTGLLSCACLRLNAEEQQHVFFIGNSLTMSTTLDRVHDLFDQRGVDLQFGSTLSAGKSLIRHLNYKTELKFKWQCWETNVKEGDRYEPSLNHWKDPESAWRFGRWDTAWVNHDWDRIVLQLYGSNLHDDLVAIPAFLDLIRKEEATDTVYLYSTWPRRPAKKGPDGKRTKDVENVGYAEEWTAKYTASAEDTDWKANLKYASRDYVNTLWKALPPHAEGLKLRLIPTAEVLFVIDRKIKAGELPGLKELAERDPPRVPGLDDDTDFSHGVNVLYADGIHLNPQPHKNGTVGIFISGSTLYTVLSGQSPVGLSAAGYGLDDVKDAALIRAIQETIWDVVRADARTGVR